MVIFMPKQAILRKNERFDFEKDHFLLKNLKFKIQKEFNRSLNVKMRLKIL